MSESGAHDGSGGVKLAVRPHLGVGDLALQLWRSKWLMLLVALPIFLLAMLFVLQLPTTYTAVSRVQVSLGKEYIYDPVIGDAGRGAALETEGVLQAEVEKAYSPVIAQRVLDAMGVARIYPEIQADIDAAETQEDRLEAGQQALKALQDGFDAGHAPKSPVLRLLFNHEDPVIAADTANAFLDAYLTYRNEVSASTDLGAVTLQREEFDARLSLAEEDIRTFLLENRIGDFETEKTAVATLNATIADELFKVEASGQEAAGRVSSLRLLLQATPPEIDLYVDSSGDQQLLDLQMEREQLLTRYRPESQRIQEIDSRISNMQQLLRETSGGVRRRGPNPAFQELQSNLASAQTDVDAANSRAAELRRQMQTLQVRRAELTRIEPEYNRLVRDRNVLDESVRTLASREQSKRAETRIAAETEGSVFVMDRALPPISGSSMKFPAALASFMFASFTGLMAGLARVFTRNGLSTRSSAEKTIGLPVIGAISHKK